MEKNIKKNVCVIYLHTHTHKTESLCCPAEINTTLYKSTTILKKEEKAFLYSMKCSDIN